MAALITAAVSVVFLGNLAWSGVVAVEVIVLAAFLLIERFAAPVVERWDRGEAGEEHVGRVLEPLEADGWLTLMTATPGGGTPTPSSSAPVGSSRSR